MALPKALQNHVNRTEDDYLRQIDRLTVEKAELKAKLAETVGLLKEGMEIVAGQKSEKDELYKHLDKFVEVCQPAVVALKEAAELRVDLDFAQTRIEELKDVLQVCLEYFHDREDVNDSFGEGGFEPVPNKEMSLAEEIRKVLP